MSLRVPCILLACLALALAQDVAKHDSGKHVKHASDLTADTLTSNHLFNDNKVNYKANLADVMNASNVTIEPADDADAPNKMYKNHNTSNFLVTQVAAFMQKVFGNITRHSPGEPERKPEKNATVAEPALGSDEKYNTTGTRSLHRVAARPADLGRMRIPQRRKHKTYTRLHVLPRVGKARVMPDEA